MIINKMGTFTIWQAKRYFLNTSRSKVQRKIKKRNFKFEIVKTFTDIYNI